MLGFGDLTVSRKSFDRFRDNMYIVLSCCFEMIGGILQYVCVVLGGNGLNGNDRGVGLDILFLTRVARSLSPLHHSDLHTDKCVR